MGQRSKISQGQQRKTSQGRKRIWKKIIFFLFTSFPEDFNACNMNETFQSYGATDEVMIPSKRDIRGRRYGFVRLFDVKHEALMATNLDNVFIGSKKLYVNIPYFQRRLHWVDKANPIHKEVSNLDYGNKLVNESAATHKVPHKPNISSSCVEVLRANESSHTFKEERCNIVF